ncbi:MAG: Fic family protein [Elusimicrobia bacterium]|nr:Fic family protein [Elusimicrobiota bacterium]
MIPPCRHWGAARGEYQAAGGKVRGRLQQGHPFEDGNGRLSRILTNLLLLEAGYVYVPYASLEKIIEDNKTQYYLALRQSQKHIKSEKADAAPWLHFFMGVMTKQIEVLRELLEAKPAQALLSKNQTKALALFDRRDEISTGVAARELKIPYPTARQVFGRLLELKLVERIGLGRASRYRKTTDT